MNLLLLLQHHCIGVFGCGVGGSGGKSLGWLRGKTLGGRLGGQTTLVAERFGDGERSALLARRRAPLLHRVELWCSEVREAGLISFRHQSG